MKFAFKTGRLKAVLKPLGLLLVAGMLLAGCAKPSRTTERRPRSCGSTISATMRYCEVFLIGGNP